MNSLSDFSSYLSKINNAYCMEVPSMVGTHEFVDALIATLFPIKTNYRISREEIEAGLENCSLRLKDLLYSIRVSLRESPEDLGRQFFEKLPETYRVLLSDAEAIARYDPAASCVEEIILCYPGFYCIAVYRLAHLLYEMKVPVLPRVMMEYVHSKTGIDIHPGAKIGTPFFIDHGTGIVIGETAEIGNGVRIYQGVTIGALSVEKSLANTKRHPTIGDNVVIYAGSTILGGKTVIGHDTVVGGNTWITESILPHSVVFRQHRVIVKDSRDLKEAIDFVI
ncbi:MAG: serine O-acetyltransferase EpsC [Bacteroidota bacterium]